MTSEHRRDLPHRTGEVMLTDGGLETSLVFIDGYDLPEFAAFPLIDSDEGRKLLIDYYRPYLATAVEHQVGFVLETPTWRASADWGAVLGYDADELRRVNTEAVNMGRELRAETETNGAKVVISGSVGPRGDGYTPGEQMTPDEAEAYHREQIQTFAAAGADQVSFMTCTYVNEAIGFIRAADSVGIPAVVSFTVETDGRLPTGQALRSAVEQADAATGDAALAFGVNCAHPDHFGHVFDEGGDWIGRIGLVRANASRKSHEELDSSDELDAGDPDELSRQYRELRAVLPNLTVIGGCCGTDHRHIAAIGEACFGGVPA